VIGSYEKTAAALAAEGIRSRAGRPLAAMQVHRML
jgi:hypothetical protein